MFDQCTDRSLLLFSTPHRYDRVEHGNGIACSPHFKTKAGSLPYVDTLMDIQAEKQIEVLLSRFDRRHGLGGERMVPDGPQEHPTLLNSTGPHQSVSHLAARIQEPSVQLVLDLAREGWGCRFARNQAVDLDGGQSELQTMQHLAGFEQLVVPFLGAAIIDEGFGRGHGALLMRGRRQFFQHVGLALSGHTTGLPRDYEDVLGFRA